MQVFATFTTGAAGIFGSRIILNLREAANQRKNISAMQLPTISFHGQEAGWESE